MDFDITRLPRYYPRVFVAPDLNPGNWSQLKVAFDALQARDISHAYELEKWLLDWSELISVIGGEESLRSIRKSSQTDRKDFAEAYSDFVNNIKPKVSDANAVLEKRYMESRARYKLPSERYRVFDRRLANRLALFRKENNDLQKADANYICQYKDLIAAMEVEIDGKTFTLAKAALFLEDTNRPVRQRAWKSIMSCYLENRSALHLIFDGMLDCRHRMARNCGFESYRDYSFRLRERFDYTMNDCDELIKGVEKHIIPLIRDLQHRREQTLGVDYLRPWDLKVDPEGRAPLCPFETVKQLLEGCRTIFKNIDPDFESQFHQMINLSLLDLEARKGKEFGAYQTVLEEHRFPFIFMNAVGSHLDFNILLHEAGHAFHTYAVRDEPLCWNRISPSEFGEVASMSMELLSQRYWEVFYSASDAARARHYHLEQILVMLQLISIREIFQDWVYTHPGHSHQEREEAWLDIAGRYGGIESWRGYEETERIAWQALRHLYMYPYYNIEYAIAQLGALGIWDRSREDFSSAVKTYRKALALGGSRPLRELFESAGLSFDFGEENIARLASIFRSELLG